MTDYGGHESSRRDEHGKAERNRIARMHAENRAELQEQSAALRRIETKLDGVRTVLHGPPDKPREGLIFKHDWLEKNVNRAGKLFWAAILAATTAIIAAWVSVTHGKTGP